MTRSVISSSFASRSSAARSGPSPPMISRASGIAATARMRMSAPLRFTSRLMNRTTNLPPRPNSSRIAEPLTSSEKRSRVDGRVEDPGLRLASRELVDGRARELAHGEHDVRVDQHVPQRLTRERHTRGQQDLACSVRDDREGHLRSSLRIRGPRRPSGKCREEVDGVDLDDRRTVSSSALRTSFVARR